MASIGLAAVVLLMCAAGAGCAPAGRAPVSMSTGEWAAPEPSTTCPFGIPGARLSMSDHDDGVVIALRAYGDVGEVRRRAHDAAAMYGPGAHRGLGHQGVHGGGHRHGLGLSQLGVPVRAEAENTPEGARITVRPEVATDMEAMRAALWKREGSARRGDCP